ncbi:hypothetical protein ACG9ZL_12440 [Acinetobacter sp. ULE_I057]
MNVGPDQPLKGYQLIEVLEQNQIMEYVRNVLDQKSHKEVCP